MARPIWKGNITFGLVNVPVVVFPAEKNNDLSFRLLDSRDQARVRYERVNEITGEEVPWDQVVKGFEYDDNNYVLLTDEDFKKVAIEANKAIEIETFVKRNSIHDFYFDKPYYLVPGKKGEKGYVLLREALKKSGMAGISKVVIRTRQYLAAVEAVGDALVLNLMRFNTELRKPEEFDLPVGTAKTFHVSEKEIEIAMQLIEAMSDEWKPENYKDEYREALMAWIEKKAKTGVTASPIPEDEDEEPEAAKVVDMMDLLKRSMAERGEKGKAGGAKGDKKVAKKAPKKAAKGKTAAPKRKRATA